MDPKDKKPFPLQPYWQLLIVGLVCMMVFLVLSNLRMAGFPGRPKELRFSQLVALVKQDRIQSLVIEKQSGSISGEFAPGAVAAEKNFVSKGEMESIAETLVPTLLEKKVEFEYRDPSWVWEAAPFMLYTLMFGAMFYFFIFRQMRGAGGGGILSFGKSRAIRITSDNNKKTFDDVAGIDEAREEVQEIIEFLRNPAKFQRLGGRLPKGVLLIGSPGTGKTLLAKAIAGEADVPFFSISGSDFVEMFVGVGASRVRDLFEQAKSNSPCIIFLDEIDAVGRKRANEVPGSGVESAQTLNAILVEMDGFSSDDSVIVIAATNRPDVLDPALLRPGRFDRHITVDLPDIRGREEILKVHSKGVTLEKGVNLTVIARGTPTFSGADLENLVNEAALIAVMRDLDSVTIECLEEARDKVKWGKEKRSRRMDEEERRATAIHEAGHALLMLLLPNATPLHKVTIIPRGRALGATMQLPEKDEYSMGRKRILHEITVLLGGRVAEELFLNDITSGASNDIERASYYSRAMICEWGMSEELGLIHYSDRGMSEHGFFEGREFSESTAEKIDNAVRGIIDKCHVEATELLKTHKSELDMLVAALLEFEALDREEVDQILKEKSLDTIRARRKAERESQDEKKQCREKKEAAERKREQIPDAPDSPPLPAV
jgi:cell division protease FtsH